MKKLFLQLKERQPLTKVNKSFIFSFCFHLLLFTGFTYSPVVTKLSMPPSEIDMLNVNTETQDDDYNIETKISPDNNGEANILERQLIPLGGKSSIYLPIFEVHTPPKIKIWIDPVYPSTARQAGVEGTVIVEIDIDEQGKVIKVRIARSAGHGFDQAALKAVKKSKFMPAFKSGDPVPVRVRLPVKFELE